MSDIARDGLRETLRWAGAALADELPLIAGPAGPPGPQGERGEPGIPAPDHTAALLNLVSETRALAERVARVERLLMVSPPPPVAEPIIITPPAEEPVPGAYHMAPDGDNRGDGSITQPWKNLRHASTVLRPGDTLYLRGGLYNDMAGGTGWGGTNANVYENKYLTGTTPLIQLFGTADAPITIKSYPGEWAIFDGFTHPNHPRSGDVEANGRFSPNALRFTGRHVICEDFEVRGSVGRGLLAYGDHLTFRRLIVHKNHGDGLYIADKSEGSIVDRCDFYDNFDVYPAVDAGNGSSGVKAPYSNGVIYSYCRSWNNGDDGYDLYGATRAIVHHCLAFNNGYGPKGNGMGFKMGGGNNTFGTLVRDNIASCNRRDDFDSNESWGITFRNNTSYGAGRDAFSFASHPFDDGGPENIAEGNIAFGFGRSPYRNTVTFTRNSWDLGIVDPAFVSVVPGPEFLTLAAGSPARGAGIDGGDLGAIPYGAQFALDSSGIWWGRAGGENKVYS